MSIDESRLPRHLAIIMDGNGRWARGQSRTVGHQEGANTVRRIVRECRRLGIPALTLYAFSEQNWSRPGPEVTALMELLRAFLVSERGMLLDNEIRLRAIGRVERLPARVRDVLEPLEAETAHLGKMTLTLALSYGGREELADAARALARRVRAGTLDPEGITEEAFARVIPSMEQGPVDLLVRTGGDQRISNFLLWGAAYAELWFTDKYWPDFEVDDLDDALASFRGRERRFGGVTAQR